MDRDSFIIEVYCSLVENYKTVKQQYKLRRSGFASALTVWFRRKKESQIRSDEYLL